EPKIIGQPVVVLMGNTKVLFARRTLPTKEPVVVDRNRDSEVDVAVVAVTQELNTVWKPKAHPTSMHRGCDKNTRSPESPRSGRHTGRSFTRLTVPSVSWTSSEQIQPQLFDPVVGVAEVGLLEGGGVF